MSEEKTGLREARADCGFRGLWIPREIWFDDRLTLFEKVVFARISALDNGKGCYATNKYLARFCGYSISKTADALRRLRELGLIKSESNEQGQRYIHVCCEYLSEEPSKNETPLSKNETPLSKKETPLSKKEIPLSKKEIPPIQKIDAPTSYKNTKEERINDCKRFAPPTLEEVRAYCRERNNRVDAQRFIDYYTSNGWKVGRNPMKDWKAAVRTWERNDGGGKRENKGLEWDTRTVFEVMDDDERGL
ncbi:MAG: helix-turn-helix domain-containing protein [Ruminococcus sp.]|nr:helix-turn-helix domain-containing protein [Ruminococcus sp.]